MKQLQRFIFLVYFFVATIPFCFGAQSDLVEQQQIDKVLLSLKLELETAKKDSASVITAQKHLQLGKYYQKARVYNEALEQYNNALTLVQKYDTLAVFLKNEIGVIYLSLKNSSKAKDYFNESILISSRIKYVKGEAKARSFLGSCYEKEGEYLEALQYQKESLSLFKKLGNKEGLAIVNENIGSIYEDLEQYNLAYEYFKKADEYFKKINENSRIGVLNNLGDINRKTGNYSVALTYTNNAYKLAVQFQDMYELKSAHKDLSKTYGLIGDFKKAFDHLLEAERINEELISSQNINQLNTLQAVYETKQKETQINSLLQQKKISRANQDLLLVIFGTTVLMVGILFVYFRRKRKENLKLQKYKQRMLKAELEKKAFEEKNLQHEVHVKTSALSRYSLHISQKNKILSDLSLTLTNMVDRKNIDVNANIKKLIKEINFNLHQEREWVEFNNFFEEIHPDFIKKLSLLSEENLSPAELRLGMLLRLNLSSKEIASILRVTPDSVRVARYRLRKKLPIDQKEELVSFMIAL
ncbi:tetratricopeptide repeat protein [Aquimarina algiphila]|uniref:tetratricopeptide repeat protein n=1 Tax=Aquimarina algiphila TaxID=2047982 RepID=UPI002330DD6A|nr:tetratricopeptide repeat protein [Aquimarina algiphila]